MRRMACMRGACRPLTDTYCLLVQLDMYGFGNLLYFACYGHVTHSLPWTQYSCMHPPIGLTQLAATHERLHPNGRVASPVLYNRCHETSQVQLDSLMIFCWAPAIAAATAAVAQAAGHAQDAALGSVGAAAARMNHTWDEVIARLETLREQRRPVFSYSAG